MKLILSSTIALILACSTALADFTPLNTRGGIHLVAGFVPPPSGGAEKIHKIDFPGYYTDYNITSDAYAKHLQSSATCGKVTIKGQDYAKHPCATSVLDHDQILTITCTADGKDDVYVDIQFFQSGEVTLTGYGNIWGGFTNEDQSKELQIIPGPDNQLTAKGDDVGVIVNCNNNNRKSSDDPLTSDPQK